jgi:hypothetical protein
MSKLTRKLSTTIISLASIVLATGVVPIEIASKSTSQPVLADHVRGAYWRDMVWDFVDSTKKEGAQQVHKVFVFSKDDQMSWEDSLQLCYDRGGDDVIWRLNHKTCIKYI